MAGHGTTFESNAEFRRLREENESLRTALRRAKCERDRQQHLAEELKRKLDFGKANQPVMVGLLKERIVALTNTIEAKTRELDDLNDAYGSLVELHRHLLEPEEVGAENNPPGTPVLPAWDRSSGSADRLTVANEVSR